MINLKRCLQIGQIGLLLTAAPLSAQAGSFSSDFNSGALPPGTHTNANAAGGAYLELTGGHTTEEMRKRYRHLYPSAQQNALKWTPLSRPKKCLP